MRRQIGTICRFAWAASPGRASLVVVLAILSSLTSVMLGIALKVVVDATVDDRPGVAALGAVVAALAFGTLGMGDRIVVRNLREHLTQKVAVALDTEVLGQMAQIPQVDHLDDPDFVDQVNLLKGRGDELARGAWGLVDLVGLLVEIVVGAAVLALVDPMLALVPLLALPVLLVSHRWQRRVDEVVERTEHLRRSSDALHELFIHPASGQEMRLSRSAGELDRQASRCWDEAAARRIRARLLAQVATLPGWVLFGVGLVGGIAVIANAYVEDRATLGDVVLLWILATQLRTKVGAGVVAAATLSGASATARRLGWLQRYAAAHAPATDGASDPELDDEGLMLNSVSFRYPGAAAAALADIDLRVPRGTTLAIVGANGAGKTTLVKLLCQLYRPTTGRITFGGVDLADVVPTEWRRGLASSFQDFMRLETTTRWSVGVGDLPCVDDTDTVTTALRKVEGGTLLDRLPRGLDTHLGTTYQPGVVLSTGEWQKVAGARALMRARPNLLVLDEPTAALDPASEHAIFRRFAEGSATARAAGTITVLVSHRFSTVRMADLIVVLEAGRIVELGGHEELMQRAGLYAEMFNLQAAAYA